MDECKENVEVTRWDGQDTVCQRRLLSCMDAIHGRDLQR